MICYCVTLTQFYQHIIANDNQLHFLYCSNTEDIDEISRNIRRLKSRNQIYKMTNYSQHTVFEVKPNSV